MAYGSPGTWNWYGINLPDFGLTEAAFGGVTQNPAVINPAVQQYMFPSATQPVTQTLPATIPPNPQSPLTSPPVPQTQQPGGPGDSELQQLAKMNRNPSQEARYQQLLSQQSPWTSAPQVPSMEDINQIYQPGMNTLNAQEAQFRSEQPSAEQKVGTSYQEGLSLLDKNLATQEAALAKQGAAIATNKANALAQARQLYAELQQKYGTMFGSRSSAGPAAQELLGRETSRQFGNIENQSSAAQQDVESERARLTSWVGDQKNTLLQKKTDALGEIQRTFTTGLAQINAQRGQLESAKAAARVDLLNQARAQTQQVEAANTQFNRQIQMFQAQQEAQLQQMAYAKQLQGYNPAPFNPPQMGVPSAQSAGYNFSPTSGQKPGMIWDPLHQQWVNPQ